MLARLAVDGSVKQKTGMRNEGEGLGWWTRRREIWCVGMGRW